jgi:O-antigen/teichoic acid export membrane protein/SAM-dependent methyltransferase
MNEMSFEPRSILLRLKGGTSVRARLARATGWMLGGSVLQQGFAMLAGIATARILGTVRFGELGVVRSTTVVFATLAGSGLGIATTRYVAALRVSDPARAGRVISLLLRTGLSASVVAAFIMVVLSRPIAVSLVGAPQIALPIAISAITIIAASVGGVQLGVISGCEAFRVAAIWGAAEGIAGAVLLIAGAWFGGVTGATIGSVVGITGIVLLRHEAMRLECRRAGIALDGREWHTELPILGTFVVPAILVAIATQPAEWLGRILLARSSNGLAEVGWFTGAYTWAQLVLFIPTQIASPVMPMLSNLFAAGDRVAFRRLLRDSAAMVWLVAFGVATPLAILSPWVMRSYGRDFASAAPVLALMAFAYALGSVTTVFRATLLAVGKAWLQNVHSVIWGMVLTVAFLFWRAHGGVGLAWSYILAFAALVIVQLGTLLHSGRSHLTNDPLNRPMTAADVSAVSVSRTAREIRDLVADYARNGLPVMNGSFQYSNLREGSDQALTCSAYRLWEYSSLFLAHDPARPWNRALDVGGAGSPLPYLLASKGMRTRAIDLQPLLVAVCSAVAAARQLPLDAAVEDVTADAVDATTYDLITFVSVLEHIPHALHGPTFEALHRRLGPDGVLYLTFDYGDYVERDKYRTDPASVEESRSISDLRRLCDVIERAGFEFIGNDPRTLPAELAALRKAPRSRDVYRQFMMTVGPLDAATPWRALAGYLGRRLLRFPPIPPSRFDQHNFFRMFLRKRG